MWLSGALLQVDFENSNSRQNFQSSAHNFMKGHVIFSALRSPFSVPTHPSVGIVVECSYYSALPKRNIVYFQLVNIASEINENAEIQ